jgi:hypothetical protein
MPGDQLQNYDMVIEFSEQAYNNLFGALFDSGNFICNIVGDVTSFLHLPSLPCPVPLVSVSFDVPTDITLPSGTSNVVDVRVQLGQNSSTGSLRFVAKVDVDHTSTAAGQLDLVQVDLSATGLLYTTITLNTPVGSITNTNDALTKALKAIGSLPVVPVPVNRTSTAPTDIVSADIHLIDDQSPQSLDASALLLTFGGGTPGNQAGFTQSFIPVGKTGAIGVGFDWICRIIRPQLAAALKIPVSDFDAPCSLNTSVSLPGDHDPKLTALELTLVDGAIHVSAAVSADGTGWSATATVGGSILIQVVNGNLVIKSSIDNPDINVSLDWWVYLAAAVIGAIIGGIIGGVIGAIIGAVLIPLVTWLASNLLNGIINAIAAKIVNALQGLNLNIDVSAIGLNIFFQSATLDDIVIGAQVNVTENAPIRSEGTITVLNGQWFDLDNGKVGDHTLAGADMAWDGEKMSLRTLDTLCCSELARTWETFFDLARYQLYGLYYAAPVSIPENELAREISIFGIELSILPTLLVYAVQTNEERYSVIQVVQVTESSIVVRYRTYEKPLPVVQIVGGFDTTVKTLAGGHGIVGVGIKEEDAEFTPSIPVVAARAALASSSSAPPESPVLNCADRAKLGITGPGTWTISVPTTLSEVGVFQAVTENFDGTKYEWSVNRKKLTANSGTLDIQGVSLGYAISDGKTITFTPGPSSSGTIWFELAVIVVDTTDDSHVSTSRCIEVVLTGSTTTRQAVASFPVYQQAFASVFGSLEIPAASNPQGATGTQIQ